MFGRILLLAFSLALAGCAPGGADTREAQLTIEGMQAFTVGDAVAIHAAETKLAALYPQPTPYPNPCSREDYTQRRQAAFIGLLQDLERQSEAASSDEDRFDRFQKALLDMGGDAGQPNDSACAQSAEKAQSGAQDSAERVAVLLGARDIIVRWAAKLGHPIKEA